MWLSCLMTSGRYSLIFGSRMKNCQTSSGWDEKNSKNFCSKLLIIMKDGYKSRSLDWYNLTLCNSPIVHRFLPGNIISSNRVITEACNVGKTLQLSVKDDLGSTLSRVTVWDSIMPEMDQNKSDLMNICKDWRISSKHYYSIKIFSLNVKIFFQSH